VAAQCESRTDDGGCGALRCLVVDAGRTALVDHVTAVRIKGCQPHWPNNTTCDAQYCTAWLKRALAQGGVDRVHEKQQARAVPRV